MGTFLQDLRFTLRSFRRARARAAELAVEQREERLEALLVVLLLEARPAQLVERLLVERRSLAARQMADNATPDRVGQRLEHGVERWLPIINHYVNYYAGKEIGCQSAGRNFH